MSPCERFGLEHAAYWADFRAMVIILILKEQGVFL